MTKPRLPPSSALPMLLLQHTAEAFLRFSKGTFKSNQNFSGFLFPPEASWYVLRGEAHGEDEIEEQE